MPGFWAPTAGAADAAPLMPLIKLPAASLANIMLPLAQKEVRAVVFGMLFRATLAYAPCVFFWAQAPHNSTVVGNRYGAAAGPAELGQRVRVLEAGAAVASGRVHRTGALPVSSTSSSNSSDAATPGFVHKLRAAFVSNADSTSCSKVSLLVVRVIGAVSTSSARSAAPVPYVSHQEPLSRHQKQTILAVYGIAAPPHSCVPP